MKKLTHIDGKGDVRMVNVTAKKNTLRQARARGIIQMDSHTIELIDQGQMAKGNVLTTAKIAGIMAAKKTADLIPLCHPLELTSIDLTFSLDYEKSRIIIESLAQTTGKTGVEMEALTAVSAAALTVYDMCKAVNKRMVIEEIVLLEKSGGQSGHFVR